MTRALLGLGGNLGDPIHAMAQALRALDAAGGTRVVAVSPVYLTPPWGPVEQPPFFNACAAFETDRSADDLLTLCLSTEIALHRDRTVRWGPRTVDLDILDFGGQAIRSDRLTLPHPRMHERAFVLVPLADVAPDFGIQGVSVADRLPAFETGDIVRQPLAEDWWRTA